MIAPKIPHDEAQRLADLQALQLLDTPPERRFDRIVELASHVLRAPIAYIALTDSDRQWLKAKCGLDVDETGRQTSFCGHTILQDEPLIVPDARRDERFSDNPLVVGEPYIRFYAGHPLKGREGHNVATLCIASPEPRELGADELETFRRLAYLAQDELQLVGLVQAQHDLLQTRQQLIRTQRKLQRELTEAAAYLCSLLPKKLNGDGPVDTDYRFIASSQLGGDLFGYHWLDRQRLAVYLLDVCGHGIGASLLAVSAWSTRHRETLPEADFDRPDQVLASLNRLFPMQANRGKFFTLWYGVYHADRRELTYASAGHPPAVVVNGRGTPDRLDSTGTIIGVDPEADFPTVTRPIPPGSRMYLFSDGAFEVQRGDGRRLTLDGLIQLLDQHAHADEHRVERVLRDIRLFHGNDDFPDDFSLLELSFTK